METHTSGFKLIDTNFHDASREYALIMPYADKCYRVSTPEGMGLISYDGKSLIEPGPYTIGKSQYGRMKFANGSDGSCGFIDNTGTLVIPTKYTDANDFEHGMAKVKVGDSWGIINTDGSEILTAKWTAIGDIVAPDQKEFWVGDASDNLMHLYDRVGGKFVFPQGFFGARAFGVDIPEAAIITGSAPGTIGCINRKGEVVIPGDFDQIPHVVEAFNLLSAKAAGAKWLPIDTYRLKLRHNPKLNKGKLSETLSSELWDY